MAADLAAGEVACRRECAHGFLVHLQQFRQLRQREHVRLAELRRGSPDDDVLGPEVAVDEIRDKLPLRRLQFERRAAELLGRCRRQAHEERRGWLGGHPDIRISSCYRRWPWRVRSCSAAAARPAER